MSTEPPLTRRQRAIFQAIRTFVRVTGEPCSVSYLARKFSIHHSTAQSHIFALYRKGYLKTPSAPAAPIRSRIRD